MVSIFSYVNYRHFLKDCYKHLKENESMSHRDIAQKGGFDSGLFSKVLSGQRDISLKMIFKFSEAFELTEREQEYFTKMVFYSQLKTHSEKKICLEEMMAFKECSVKTLIEGEYEYFSKWYYAAIRDLLHIYPFTGDYKNLGNMLIPKVTPKIVKKSINLLLKLNMIEEDETGRFLVKDSFISSGTDAKSTAVNNFIEQSIERAKEAVDLFASHEKNLSSLSFNFNEENLPLLIDKIRSFRKELMSTVSLSKNNTRVFQLNIQLYPLSKSIPNQEPTPLSKEGVK